jgi:hypothetical protein
MELNGDRQRGEIGERHRQEGRGETEGEEMDERDLRRDTVRRK